MTSPRGEWTLVLAWTVALLASLSVLYIGEVLGRMPCVLCWYQRIFMFPLAVLLGLGLWWGDRAVGRYGIALAVPGAIVALWHLALLGGLVPERVQPCTAAGPSCGGSEQYVLGLPIPLLAFIAFAAIAVLSAASLRKEPAR